MLVFTIRNAVIVALAQVGLIVSVIMASGILEQLTHNFAPEALPPYYVRWLTHYGFLLLAGPLIWITGALLVHRNPEIPEHAKVGIFIFGVGLALALALLLVIVIIASLSRMLAPGIGLN